METEAQGSIMRSAPGIQENTTHFLFDGYAEYQYKEDEPQYDR